LSTVSFLLPFLSLADIPVLFPSAYIPRDDPAYKWVQAWMNNNKDIQHQLVDFTLNCRTASNLSGMDQNLIRDEVNYDSDDDEDDITEKNASWHSGLVLGKVIPRPGKFNLSCFWRSKLTSQSKCCGSSTKGLGFGSPMKTLGRVLLTLPTLPTSRSRMFLPFTCRLHSRS
jgi:hypothetical protein